MTARDDSSLREQLSALLDGELSDAEARELRRRIETDPDLRREFESLRKTVEAIRGLERVTAPVALRERLRRRPPRSRPTLRLVTGLVAGLAAAAALVIALRVGLDSEEPKSRFQEASAPEDRQDPAAGDEKRSGVEPTLTRLEEAESETGAEDAEESFPLVQRKRVEDRRATADAEAPLKEDLGRDTRSQPTAVATPSAPAEKAGRPAGERREAKGESALLATRVAAGGLVASEPERNRYLAELSKLERKDLSSHFAALESRGRRGFAATPSPVGVKKAKSRGKSQTPVAAEALVTGRNEAMLIREILRRAFPAQPVAEGGGGAGTPEIQLGALSQELFVDLDLTPGELTQVHAWLDILKDSRRAASGPGTAGREAPRFRQSKELRAIPGGVEPTREGKGPPKRPVRVRLIYAPRPAPEPDPEAKEEER